MKPLCIPDSCPLCLGPLTAVDSYGIECSTCRIGELSRFRITYAVEKYNVKELHSICLITDKYYIKVNLYISLHLFLELWDVEARKYKNSVLLPYFWVDFTNIPVLEKKIKMLLTFS